MQLQDHSTESFNEEELAEAKKYLIKRLTEFYEDSSIGFKLRANAIDKFKKEHSLERASFEEVKVQMDLESEDALSFALEMNNII